MTFSFPESQENTIGSNSVAIKSIKESLIQTVKNLNKCEMNNLELKSRVLKLELAIGNLQYIQNEIYLSGIFLVDDIDFLLNG